MPPGANVPSGVTFSPRDWIRKGGARRRLRRETNLAVGWVLARGQVQKAAAGVSPGASARAGGPKEDGGHNPTVTVSVGAAAVFPRDGCFETIDALFNAADRALTA